MAAVSECFDVVHLTFFFSFFFSLIKNAVLFVRTPLSFSWLHLSWRFQGDEQRGTVSAWELFWLLYILKCFVLDLSVVSSSFIIHFCEGLAGAAVRSDFHEGLKRFGINRAGSRDREQMEPQLGHTQVGVKPSLGTGTPAPAHSCSSATAANHAASTFPALGKFAYFPEGDTLGSLNTSQFITACLLFFRHWILSRNAFDGFLVLIAGALLVWERWP